MKAHPAGKKGVVGRADLLDCLRLWGADGLTGAACLLGYEEKPLVVREIADSRGAITSSSPIQEGEEVVYNAERPRAPFWLLETAEFKRPEDSQPPNWLNDVAVFDPEDGGEPPRLVPPSARLDLASWTRLWPFLRKALGGSDEGAEVDWRRVANDLARRGTIPRRLPTLPRRRWAGHVQLIMDYDTRVAHFWPDLNRLRRRLERLRGRTGLEVCCFTAGVDGPCRRKPGENAERPYRLPQPGTPVLAVGDLGSLDQGGGGQAAWQHLGRRLRRGGCRPTALLPVPAHRLPGQLASIWQLACWDRGERFRLGSPFIQGARQTGLPTDSLETENLLSLLSPAVFVDSDLLRAMRLLLPGADVGCEADLWHHRDSRGGVLGFGLDSARLPALRERFRQLDEPLRSKAAGLIRANHARFPEPVRREVEGVLAGLLNEPEALDATEHYFRRVAGTIKETNHLGMLAWARRFSERQHPARWLESEALPVIWALAHRDRPEGEALRPPPGLDVSRVAWLLSPEAETRHWRLVQRGERVMLVAAGDITWLGSHLGGLTTNRSLLTVEIPEIASEPRLLEAVANGYVTALPVEGGLTISSDHQRLHLRPLVMPSWAKAIGRDRAGLFVDVAEGEKLRRLYWQPPARHQVEGGGVLELTRGFWVDADLSAAWPKLLRRPYWADDFGVDQYGLFAAFVYRGVRQVLRWIAPGRFMMGSPEDEQERYDDEKLHEVTIAQGFWLADTACSQALWQAVTGDNQAHFKGDTLPVQNVSWGDVVNFIDRLNQERPSLALRLPTEAEWEFACRAGTTTPFSFGGNITPEQVNYDGNNPYVGGEKGLYRQKPVEVGSLPANPWGLYEMHGNVYEWCADWFGEYPIVPVADPLGPDRGDNRVLRGGSWIIFGRNVRSASRFHSGPPHRGRIIGFRLARGQ